MAAASQPQSLETKKKLPWPKTLPDQLRLLRETLAQSDVPLDAATAARRFTRARTDSVQELLKSLAILGQAQQVDATRYTAD